MKFSKSDRVSPTVRAKHPNLPSLVRHILWVSASVAAAAPLGCGDALNPAFTNTVIGGAFPVTPGPLAPFVFVRGSNQTNDIVEFIVTVEKETLVRDDLGNFVVDDQGNFLTVPDRQTVTLTTFPGGLSNDLGVLFDCSLEPVTIVGLGEDLLPTDAAAFVGGSGPGGTGGIGVTAQNVPPLSLAAGNFTCGDTIIFTAFLSPGTPGGIALRSHKLISANQPGQFSGPSTFENFAEFREAQIVEEE